MKKSLDVLILFILVIARVRIDTLADVVALPQRHDDVRRLVAGWWPGWSLDLLAHPESDPVSMMLVVTAFALLAGYLLVDIAGTERHARTIHRIKLVIIYAIIALLIGGKTVLLINLRHISGPASYAHDGGVIQTEITVDYLLAGRNPYIENYVDTPMAEWGYAEFRTALYHYPYLPWTFIFSAPIYLTSQALLGWFDQRMVYLLLFGLTLVLTQKLVHPPREKLIAVAVMGLNPILGVSIIFGENDPFVLAWIVLALWLVQPRQGQTSTRRYLMGSAALALACAGKPTAWFLLPFWLLYVLHDRWGDRLIPPVAMWRGLGVTLLRRVWTLPVLLVVVIGPWFAWSPFDMYDDVWRWSAGQGDTGYQIWGWGASNYVLGLGWVSDRFAYWPFLLPQFIICLPLLIFLLWRQVGANTMGMMLYGYVVFFLMFAYISRFFQPNYLGFMLGILTLAVLISHRQEFSPAGESCT